MIEGSRRRIRDSNFLNARAVVREINRRYYARRNRSGYNDAGIDIFAEDWDNLVILDACRYDAFAAHSTLPGTLEARYSRGSMTQEWLRANFTERDLTDTVYISANGQLVHLGGLDATLHAFVGVWDEEFRLGEHDPTLIPRPKTVTEHALTAADEHPDKRLLVHYVQPHFPYIGSSEHIQLDPHLKAADFPREIRTNPAVSREVIKQAYGENLDIVLDEVARLLDVLPGKTVVSADHGELLGERLLPLPLSQYGHPERVYHEKLVRIPWLVYTNGARKDIVAEEPKHAGITETFDDRDVEKHLQDLGYIV